MADWLLGILDWLHIQLHDLRMVLIMRHRCAIHGRGYMRDRRPEGGVICTYCHGP